MPKSFAACLDLTQQTPLPLQDLLLGLFQAISFWTMSGVKEMKQMSYFARIPKGKIVDPLRELVLFANLQVDIPQVY